MHVSSWMQETSQLDEMQTVPQIDIAHTPTSRAAAADAEHDNHPSPARVCELIRN